MLNRNEIDRILFHSELKIEERISLIKKNILESDPDRLEQDKDFYSQAFLWLLRQIPPPRIEFPPHRVKHPHWRELPKSFIPENKKQVNTIVEILYGTLKKAIESCPFETGDAAQVVLPRLLLELPEVANYAIAHADELLSVATLETSHDDGNPKPLAELLKLPTMGAQAAKNNNTLLLKVIKDQNWKCVIELLKVPEVSNAIPFLPIYEEKHFALYETLINSAHMPLEIIDKYFSLFQPMILDVRKLMGERAKGVDYDCIGNICFAINNRFWDRTRNFLGNKFIANIASKSPEVKKTICSEIEKCKGMINEDPKKAIKRFCKIYNEIIENIYNRKEVMGFDPFEGMRLPALLEEKISEFFKELDREPKFIFNHMYNAQLGSIDNTSGLLVTAEVSERKAQKENDHKYYFNPTILNKEEFTSYLSTLRDASFPLREKFIIAGGHWIGGEISINSKSEASLLFIDSLGTKLNDPRHSDENSIFQKAKNVFPSIKIFFSEDRRQGAEFKCFAYTLDDIRHLYTVERYLPQKYKAKGLFSYFEEKSKLIGENVYVTSLPLPLMRTAQTSNLIKKNGIIEQRDQEEQDTPVNKKGQTAIQSAKEGFVTSSSGKLINLRLDKKLQAMRGYLISYLLKHSRDEIETKMDHFTLSGFQKRLEGEGSKKRKRDEEKNKGDGMGKRLHFL